MATDPTKKDQIMKIIHKKAFTMMELIFVIVIIGILAAIAIPKLSATRDAAEISKIVANTKIFHQKIQQNMSKNYKIASIVIEYVVLWHNSDNGDDLKHPLCKIVLKK